MTRKPLAAVHRSMSLEAYHDYPRRPGWKYEYRDGQIHVTPAHVVLPMVLRLPPPRPWTAPPAGVVLRRLEQRDDRALPDLFVAAFSGAMEYVGFAPEELRESAEECLERGPRKRRGPRLEISWVAESNGEIVGAALFRRSVAAPLLDLVFVDPRRQRRGLASALVTRATAELAERGEVKVWSSVMLGNEESLAWHRRFGFTEVPHVLVAKHRRRLYRHELARHRRLGNLAAGEMAALEAQVAHWDQEARRLEALLRKDPETAFPDIY